MPNYTLDYETTDDESSSIGDTSHLPPVASSAKTNGVKRKEEEPDIDDGEEEPDAHTDDAFSIDLNDEEFRVKRTDENEHLFDIDGNYVGEIDRDFESCSDS